MFFDKILSGNRDVACATCHDVSAGLTDGRSLAVGTGAVGHRTRRDSWARGVNSPREARPSLLNAGLGLFQMFWDVRLSGHNGQFGGDSSAALPAGLPNLLTAQAMLPVLNRLEMRGAAGDVDIFGNPNELAQLADADANGIWDAIMDRLLAVSEYTAMFNAAFPGIGRPRFEHAARALATFQMQEFTRTGSPFDRYLDRDNNALTAGAEARRTPLLRQGPVLDLSQRPVPRRRRDSRMSAHRRSARAEPNGRRSISDEASTRTTDFYQFAFRVAPLRNVELTGPYFHSGAYRTLEAVVRHYNDVPKALREYDPTQLAPDVRPLYHGDPATVNAVLQTLDGRLRQPLGLTSTELGDLVAFLKALTDPAARNLQSAVPASVPSGLSVR